MATYYSERQPLRNAANDPRFIFTAADNRAFDWQNRREKAETIAHYERQAQAATHNDSSNPYAAYMAFAFRAR